MEKDGKRDRSFNGQKFVIKNDELKHIRAGTISVRNSDGAIVVAGSAAKTHDFGLPSTPWIAVLNANGSPNFGFNAGKPLFSSILPDGGFWQNCAWQENNNTILVARSVAARYLPTGQLDTSFNGKGWFDHKGMYNHMALTKDSKLVLIGYAGGYPFVLRSLL
ncbi:delta-60 repeat domain protein [compost metagenome]